MNPNAFISNFLGLLFFACELLILGRVLVSFIDPQGRTVFGRFLFQMTEPVLGPIRRRMPPTGAFDFSPLIVLIALSIVARLIGVQ